MTDSVDRQTDALIGRLIRHAVTRGIALVIAGGGLTAGAEWLRHEQMPPPAACEPCERSLTECKESKAKAWRMYHEKSEALAECRAETE